MSVKWVADAARELGMDVFDAIELLASKQNYPMNGLLDEDRVLLLKRYRVEASGGRSSVFPAPHLPPPPATAAAPPQPPPVPRAGPEGKAPGETSSVTAPLQQQIQKVLDKAEEKTVIMPAPPAP